MAKLVGFFSGNSQMKVNFLIVAAGCFSSQKLTMVKH